MRGRRAASVAGAVVTAVLLGVGSVAWACTVQTRIVAITPESGPERSMVTVRGEGLGQTFDGRGVPVELRWNGARGPLVGTALVDKAGRFSSDIQLPQAAPGVYTLVAVVDGVGMGRMAFEVTGSSTSPAPALAAPSAAPAQLWATPSGSGSGPPVGVTAGAALFALGMVGVAAGFTVAALRRRRVTASSS